MIKKLHEVKLEFTALEILVTFESDQQEQNLKLKKHVILFKVKKIKCHFIFSFR